MGMSASQMRYCMIAGKKSDIEFQGQQINQQRTTLATETSSYNSQLLTLSVPTPPSTSDYTTTSYTFSSNGQKRTVTGTIYNSTDDATTGAKAGTYTVNYTTSSTAPQGESTGTSVFVKDGTNYKTTGGTVLTLASLDDSSAASYATDTANVAQIEKDCGIPKYRTATGAALNSINMDSTSTGYSAADITNLQTVFGGAYSSTAQYFKYTEGSGATAKTYYVAGSAIAAGATANVTGRATDASTNAASLTKTQFYKYGDGVATKYVLSTALASSTATNPASAISTYDVNETATVKTSSQMVNASVTWSNSGRMSSIKDKDGNTFSLSVENANDNNAYENAYNDYEYKKNVYEQDMNKINSKITIVETQDKKLELKLQNLDTQQQALSTEMDSVKKVIDKNIEASFKAFA